MKEKPKREVRRYPCVIYQGMTVETLEKYMLYVSRELGYDIQEIYQGFLLRTEEGKIVKTRLQ